MRVSNRLRVIAVVVGAAGLSTSLGTGGCSLFQSEQVSRGQALYNHYCMHCHGEHGRQNEGFNWSAMPDPRPKDLSNKGEMSTFTDEEIFATISRDMKDTGPGGDPIGDDEFAVPTMPTFKYTLSEEEIWAIVAYVRTLHGMKLTYNVEARKKELQDALEAAKQKYDQAVQAAEEAEKRANEEAEKKGTEVDESAFAKEQQALAAAKKEMDRAQTALANFTSRPKFAAVPRPDLTMMTSEAGGQLAEVGKRLYSSKYGCNGCHRIGGEGGEVGPALDRAGFRLNATWMYRWIRYPQAMKPETRMPNLGVDDADAKAITVYLSTLRAPRPDKPITQAAN